LIRLIVRQQHFGELARCGDFVFDEEYFHCLVYEILFF
jgi:AAA+ superfamily predicted ATPase